MRTPLTHRLLLLAYPAWFRAEYGGDLARHLAHQRSEARYRQPVLGAALFWWHAGVDALLTGARLRVEGRGRERPSRQTSGGRRVHGPERTGVAIMLEAIIRDVRHALRALARNPGYTIVFVLTLGLGIGANAAMFSAVNGVLLRPLPHENGDRLVYLRHSAALADIDNALFSVPEIDDYRKQAPSLEAVAEFSTLSFTMLGLDTPRRVRAGIVTGNFFEVMGLSAALGRTIGPEDDGPAAASVIVLSHPYWRSVFGSDPGVLGRTVEINNRTATIVGVAEPSPPYPERTEIYVNLATSPHHMDASMAHDRTHRMTEVFARLAPRATLDAARAEVGAVTSRLHAAYPEAYDSGSGYDVSVTPLKTQLTTRARPTLLLLLGTAFLVLVIACANLANLTLTRVLRREHELAIRVSLGGGRGALRRALLVESLVLALAGAALGLLIAFVSLDLIVAFTERFTSRASEVALDGNVLAFALAAAVGASLFFTLLPALPDDRGVGSALARSGTRSTGAASARRAQRALVVAQIGTSFVLLIGAGLLLRTMIHLENVDPGFETARVVSMNIPVDFGAMPTAQLRTRRLAMLEDVAAVPGVQSAALTSAVPLAGPSTFSLRMEMAVEGHQPPPGAPTQRADFRVVSPGYFATMGIDVLRGRDFVATDVEDAQKVVVINESMARAYFADRDPIGGRIAWTGDNLRFMGLGKEWRTVVGVVGDTRDAGLDAEVPRAIYMPYMQVMPWFTNSLVLRTSAEPAAVIAGVRTAILSHDPNQPIVNVATLAERGAESVAPRRLNTLLLGAFALLALVIAAVGIGGVLAFSVGSRKREFGVRSALGAARHQIWSGVVREGALLAGLGVALGGVAAVGLARLMAGLLVGVRPLDPVTFAGVGLLLAAVAVGAAWAPAWRAARVSPMEALGGE